MDKTLNKKIVPEGKRLRHLEAACGRGPLRGSWVMGSWRAATRLVAGRYAARGGPLRGSWWAATRRVAGRYAARGGRRAA